MISRFRHYLSKKESKETESQLYARCVVVAELFGQKTSEELTPEDMKRFKMANASARQLGYNNWQQAYWELKHRPKDAL